MEIKLNNRVSDMKIVSKQFTGDNGQTVQYKRLVITGVLNGNVKEIEIPISRDKADLIEALSDKDTSLYPTE